MKKFFRRVANIILVYILLSFLINLVKIARTHRAACNEYSRTEAQTGDNHHYRYWRLGDSHGDYCTDYVSSHRLSASRAADRKNMSLRNDDYKNYWGTVYGRLVSQNEPYLDFIADSLINIGQKDAMDRQTLAELIVSFVQDIPYSYIMPQDCESVKTSGHPCVGNEPFGILSPYEFLHTLAGDCDTRAVLLFALFQKLGYDPMIVVSDEYAHAMLALNIPATGDYLTYRKNKYYFWETTATGWQAGILPPSCNNVDYWKIALANEL